MNLGFWLRRASYTKKWHLIHYVVSNALLLVNVPPVLCDPILKPAAVLYFSMSYTSQVFVFAKVTALTNLHMAIVWALALLMQFGALWKVLDHQLASFDVCVIVNCSLTTFIYPFIGVLRQRVRRVSS